MSNANEYQLNVEIYFYIEQNTKEWVFKTPNMYIDGNQGRGKQ
jgi:hypothetical protein